MVRTGDGGLDKDNTRRRSLPEQPVMCSRSSHTTAGAVREGVSPLSAGRPGGGWEIHH